MGICSYKVLTLIIRKGRTKSIRRSKILFVG